MCTIDAQYFKKLCIREKEVRLLLVSERGLATFCNIFEIAALV